MFILAFDHSLYYAWVVGSEVHKAVSDAGLYIGHWLVKPFWLRLGAGAAERTSHIASKNANEAVYLHQSLALACQVLIRLKLQSTVIHYKGSRIRL